MCQWLFIWHSRITSQIILLSTMKLILGKFHCRKIILGRLTCLKESTIHSLFSPEAVSGFLQGPGCLTSMPDLSLQAALSTRQGLRKFFPLVAHTGRNSLGQGGPQPTKWCWEISRCRDVVYKIEEREFWPENYSLKCSNKKGIAVQSQIMTEAYSSVRVRKKIPDI